jgi:hypothetical protein
MFAKPTPSPAPSQRVLRLAWCLAFLLTIALIAGISSARAADLPTMPGAGATIAPPFEEGECEPGEPDCEEEGDENEDEECELGEDGEEECVEVGDGENEAPPECLLTTARPRVSISAAQQRLRLDVRYTLTDPADVAIGLRSSGGKGSMAVPTTKHHLSHSGNFHETFELSEAETERALGAKQFTVRLHVLDVPWSCHRYDFRHLNVRHGGEQSPVFSETSADLRSGR